MCPLVKTALLCSASYVSWQRDTARICCCGCSRRSISAALPAGPTAANPPQRHVAAEWWDRQTDGRTNAQQFQRPCPHTVQAVSIILTQARLVIDISTHDSSWSDALTNNQLQIRFHRMTSYCILLQLKYIIMARGKYTRLQCSTTPQHHRLMWNFENTTKFYTFYLSFPCSRLSWLMSAFERMLK